MSKPLSRFNQWNAAHRRARPRKGSAWVGLEALENRTMLSVGPTIASVTGTPDPAVRAAHLEITANGITDTGGLVRSVVFYLDVNGDGIFDKGDKRLGDGKLVAGTDNYELSVHTLKWALGTNEVLAVATDNHGIKGESEGGVTIDNRPPHIAALSVAHNVAAAGNSVKLTATGITDPEHKIKIASVAFYLDSNNNGVPDSGELLAVDSNKKGGWTISVNLPDTLPTTGNVTFLAVATGTDGTAGTVKSKTVNVDAPPTITLFNINSTVVAREAPVTLTASGVSDSDGTVKRVSFFLDANHDGVLDAGDKLLGNGKKSISGTDFVLTTNLPASTPTGPATFFAVPVDNQGITGFAAPAATGVTGITISTSATVGPAIGSLTSGSQVVTLGGSVTLTASNVIAEPGDNITDVEFFIDSDGNGKLDSRDQKLATVTAPVSGTNNYQFVYTAPANTAATSATFFAVAQDGAKAVDSSTPSSVQVFYAPSVGSLTSSAGSIALGGSLTLTASSFTVGAGKTLLGVEFFLDTNGNGVFDSGTDQDLGSGTLTSGSYQLMLTVPATQATGPTSFFAVAVDSDNVPSPAASVQVTIRPAIGALSTNPPEVGVGNSETLTASGLAVGGGATIHGVEFYLDANGDGLFELDTDTDLGAGTPEGSGNYQFVYNVPPSTPAGSATFFAVLSDNNTVPHTSAPATVQVAIRPAIAALTPAFSSVVPGDALTLTASGLNAGGGGTVKGVEFFLDTNNDGVFESGVDTDLGAGTPDGSGNYDLTYNVPSNTAANTTLAFLAVLSDSDTPPHTSPPAVAQVTVINPSITTLTPSVTTIGIGGSVTLTASGISVGAGTVQNVEFFLDNGDGTFQLGTDTDLGSGTVDGNGNYALTFNLPQTTPLGTATFFAVVTNTNSVSSPPATAHLTVT